MTSYYEHKLKKDLKFGFKGEDNVKPLLEHYFKVEFKKTAQYATFDFINRAKKIRVELKTRRIRKNQYYDIMISYNKVSTGFKHIKDGWSVYFCWKFEDGLSFYKLDKDTFKDEWVRSGGRYDRGKSEPCKCAYIPTRLLKDIRNDNTIDTDNEPSEDDDKSNNEVDDDIKDMIKNMTI